MPDLATSVPAARLGIRRWLRSTATLTDAAPATAPTAFSVFVTAIWCGLLVGPLELALTLALKPVRDPTPGLFRMNRHLLWIIPLDNLVMFAACGIVGAIAVRLAPRQTTRLALFALGFVGFLSLLLTFRPLLAWAEIVLSCGLGYRFCRRAERNWPQFQRFVRRSLPILTILCVGLGGGSFFRLVVSQSANASTGAGRTTAVGSPNVVLIVLDTVRADRLSLYGYGRDTTPNLKRLAREGTVFQQARSTAPWTLPSHASMMTGRWPHQLSADLSGPLDSTYPTLAEFLTRHGYDTAGFVANLTYTGAESGLSRGFGFYEDHNLSPLGLLTGCSVGSRIVWELYVNFERLNGRSGDGLRKTGAVVTDQILDWVASRESDEPFFVFANYYDVHNPYIPPEGFSRGFGRRPEFPGDSDLFERWFVHNKKALTPRQIELVNDCYDDCLAYLDEQLGRLFDELQRMGQLENTLVIVTADHGEHLGEHGLYGHASSLYDQEVHVPLLVVAPKKNRTATRVVDEPASLRELPATIADITGFAYDSPFPGRSLARHWASDSVQKSRSAAEPMLTEVDEPVLTPPNQGRSPVFRGSMKSLVSAKQVYIKNGDGVEELYDVGSDPAELRNLAKAPEYRAVLERFRAQLGKVLESEPPIQRPKTR